MRVVLASLFAFAVSIGSAAMLYPGGTWHSRDTSGYSFWDNYWCDLVLPVALNGEPNLWGSRLSRVSFVCFASALAYFWPIARELTGPGVRCLAASRLGFAGAVGLLLAALFPSTSAPLLHGIAVVFAVLASVVAAFVFSIAQRAQGELWGAALGAATAMVALLCVGLYLRQGLSGVEAPYLPSLQKTTTLLLLAWMARLMWLARRARTDHGSRRAGQDLRSHR